MNSKYVISILLFLSIILTGCSETPNKNSTYSTFGDFCSDMGFSDSEWYTQDFGNFDGYCIDNDGEKYFFKENVWRKATIRDVVLGNIKVSEAEDCCCKGD